ncbi:MAG: hypothetical protein WCJ37_20075, partial [Syntrophus sp. (in: bacteria)]
RHRSASVSLYRPSLFTPKGIVLLRLHSVQVELIWAVASNNTCYEETERVAAILGLLPIALMIFSMAPAGR